MVNRAYGKDPMMRLLAPLPECDPVSVAPLNKAGNPDLYNHMPTRLIPKDEALVRGWSMYYDASICRYGHQAPRWTKNPRLCVDCTRLKHGKGTIGGRASSITDFLEIAPHSAPDAGSAPDAEPDSREKRFLEAYAKFKDLGEASKAVGITVAQVQARLSWSKAFRDAINSLEERANIPRTVLPSARYYWSEDKRDTLIEVFVDTGDLATARDSIKCSPSEYFREIERNADFRERLLIATKLAEQALEEKAIQLALGGNDRLLTKILSAKKPEYRDRVQMDMNVTEKLDDRQLESRLARFIGKYGQDVVEGEFKEIIPSGEAGTLRITQGTGSAEADKQVLPILQHSGES